MQGDTPGRDDGLRKMMVGVAIALVLALAAAALIAHLAIRVFDPSASLEAAPAGWAAGDRYPASASFG